MVSGPHKQDAPLPPGRNAAAPARRPPSPRPTPGRGHPRGGGGLPRNGAGTRADLDREWGGRPLARSRNGRLAQGALAAAVITIDTSALFVLLNRRDPDHEAAKRALDSAGRPYLVPSGILAEIMYLLEQRMPATADRLLVDLESGAFGLDCGDRDLTRIRGLVGRYADLPLGFGGGSGI